MSAQGGTENPVEDTDETHAMLSVPTARFHLLQIQAGMRISFNFVMLETLTIT